MKDLLILFSVMLRFHKCKFDINVYDIPMENNTNFLIKQCKCGKTSKDRVHRESMAYYFFTNEA